MIKFWFGLFCAAVSGGVTWMLTADPTWTGIAAASAALLVWLGGGLALVVFDD